MRFLFQSYSIKLILLPLLEPYMRLFCYNPHMPIGMTGIISVTVVLFFVCPQDFGNVVTDISGVG